jgi:hypothetical protein
MKKQKSSSNLVKMLLVIVLLSQISCDSKTVFFWNWKDVIGLAFLGVIVFVTAMLFLAQWCDDKIKLWKRNRSKK